MAAGMTGNERSYPITCMFLTGMMYGVRGSTDTSFFLIGIVCKTADFGRRGAGMEGA